MAAKNVDTCTSKGMPLLNYYCEAVLSRLGFGSTKESSKGGISSPSTVTGGDKTALPEADDRRLLPIKLREVLIIARFSSGVNAAPKKEGTNPLSEEQLDNNCEKRTIIRRELDAILDATRKDAEYRVLGVCPDYPGAQRSKSYYLERIKEHLLACSDAAVIWYTGTSERNTGNWCFMDGVVSFQDILELYFCHFRARLLYLVCDCSFSGRWVHEMAKVLDSCDVPACGHYVKEQGLTIKVFVSCGANEEATEMCYVREGVKFDKSLWFLDKKLSSGQNTISVDFTSCRCGKTLKEACQINHAWLWMDKINGYQNLYWVKGFDHGKPAWHCVLLKEEKRAEFILKTQQEAGKHTLNLLEYGKVLRSGWGKEPPDDIVKKIDKQYDL